MSNGEAQRCEDVFCSAVPKWQVRAGSRVTDAQYSCGRHLDRTCEAMAGAELPRTAEITLLRLRPGP